MHVKDSSVLSKIVVSLVSWSIVISIFKTLGLKTDDVSSLSQSYLILNVRC